MTVGDFYERLEKFQEALEVYLAVSKKVDHLDVPIKFEIFATLGHLFSQLNRYEEALKAYETAFAGYEVHLGRP